MTEKQARAIASELFTLRKLIGGYIGVDLAQRVAASKSGSDEAAALQAFIKSMVEFDSQADEIFRDCMGIAL